ncbi:glycosyltransferase family 2 protein [Pedobacter insulae]|uniref:Glycosyltransferase involved in cell wall bisynthesis n=1 Tax=Pedobacter insulae TaxID=414048 RepID=A0A1I2VVG6_9SPHI|nr:glycosyltransferase [Pedobacter insulae]SFG93225.1 Glycosyltransferase involved in cell wall bisynthesis [Pedobacter insulae]
MKPEISILLPVRNGADFIYESIASVLKQDHLNFELLISDDHSNDNTLAIINQFDDDRITVFKQSKGLGQFGNFNFLLKNAKAPIVQFWSHDDVMLPELVSTVLNFHQTHQNLGMSYCGSNYINEAGEITISWQDDQTPVVLNQLTYAQFSIAFGCLAGSISQVSLNIKNIEGDFLFNENLKHSGDFELWTRIAKKYPVGFINTKLCLIRNHANQVTHRPVNTLHSILENIPILRELLSRLNAPDYFKQKVKREIVLVYYFNTAIKLLYNREFKAFTTGLSALAKEDNIFLLALYWAKSKALGKAHFAKHKASLIDQLFTPSDR